MERVEIDELAYLAKRAQCYGQHRLATELYRIIGESITSMAGASGAEDSGRRYVEALGINVLV